MKSLMLANWNWDQAVMQYRRVDSALGIIVLPSQPLAAITAYEKTGPSSTMHPPADDSCWGAAAAQLDI